MGLSKDFIHIPKSIQGFHFEGITYDLGVMETLLVLDLRWGISPLLLLTQLYRISHKSS